MTKWKPLQLPHELPCGCANLRRAARAVTRMYNRELRSSGLELTQFTLLMALDLAGESSQKKMAELLAIDSTTLTRSLASLIENGWIAASPGADRREKLLSLTAAGRQKYRQSLKFWQRAQEKLRAGIGKEAWRQMGRLLGNITAAAGRA